MPTARHHPHPLAAMGLSPVEGGGGLRCADSCAWPAPAVTAGWLAYSIMGELPQVMPPGLRVRVRFGRYTGHIGIIADEAPLLLATEPLVWVRFDGGT
jgi:hypothetical protein